MGATLVFSSDYVSTYHGKMNIMTASRYCAECGKEEGALVVSRHVRRVSLLSIAMHRANESIGRSIKNIASSVPPSYATRRSSRTHRRRKTVPSASYQCHLDSYRVLYFHPRLYHPYQSKISRMPTRGWQIRIRTNIIHVRKSICGGCVYFFRMSRNNLTSPFCISSDNCPICKTDRTAKTNEVAVDGIMRRAEANDAGAMNALASYYHHGRGVVQHLLGQRNLVPVRRIIT
jgi:hypothetical protein